MKNNPKPEPAWLLEYSKDVYSQTGEDGVLGKILEILPENDRWCVEFGAWDGIHLSNVRNLIVEQGYSAVLIEGSAEKCVELKRNSAPYEGVITLNRFVGFTPEDSLDTILRETPIPNGFDLLSIDVDGNDYHIWKAISDYSPKVVCIEFNPTIPTEVEFVQEPDMSVSHGSSLRSLVGLGKEKGYELVSVLPYNAVFVRAEYFALFDIENNAPEALRKFHDFVTYIFSGYDGHVFVRGCTTTPWHKRRVRESKMQVLPKVLQRFPDNYDPLQRFLFKLCKVLDKLRQRFLG